MAARGGASSGTSIGGDVTKNVDVDYVIPTRRTSILQAMSTLQHTESSDFASSPLTCTCNDGD